MSVAIIGYSGKVPPMNIPFSTLVQHNLPRDFCGTGVVCYNSPRFFTNWIWPECRSIMAMDLLSGPSWSIKAWEIWEPITSKSLERPTKHLHHMLIYIYILCVHMWIITYIYIYTYICKYKNMYICMYIYIYTHVDIYIYTYVYTYVYIYI